MWCNFKHGWWFPAIFIAFFAFKGISIAGVPLLFLIPLFVFFALPRFKEFQQSEKRKNEERKSKNDYDTYFD